VYRETAYSPRSCFAVNQVTLEISKARDRDVLPKRPGKGVIGATVSKVKGDKSNVQKQLQAKDLLGDLPKERRTSYERRRSMGKSLDFSTTGDISERRSSRQWGPRQIVYSPPEMK